MYADILFFISILRTLYARESMMITNGIVTKTPSKNDKTP